MKRTATILFLLILLFNLVGYKLVVSSLQQSAVAAVETKVDAADYNEADLISIKTALNLPYYTPSAEFERTYGSITVDGKDYEYVKRRVYNDTLEVLCLPNHDKTKLKKVEQNLAKASADGQASTEKKGSTTIKLPLPDFFQQTQAATVFQPDAVSRPHYLTTTSFLPEGYGRNAERPPSVYSLS